MKFPDDLKSGQPLFPPMTSDRFAAMAESTGARIFKQDDIWWKQGSPFFYRPLLPFRKYDWERARKSFNTFGAFQHGVKDGQPQNSYIDLVVYDDVRNYDANNLHRGERRNLDAAMKNRLTVRRLTDEEAFVAEAYDVYLSFYQRTRYRFDVSRTKRDGFARWALTLFQFPELVILGAFSERELVSFEISCLVEDTFLLNTSIHSDTGLRLRSPDFMLHWWRTIAREDPRINLIYGGMMSTPGIDTFKLRRGARIVAAPAFLHVNPFVLWLLRTLSKSRHRRLIGLNPNEALATGAQVDQGGRHRDSTEA